MIQKIPAKIISFASFLGLLIYRSKFHSPRLILPACLIFSVSLTLTAFWNYYDDCTFNQISCITIIVNSFQKDELFNRANYRANLIIDYCSSISVVCWHGYRDIDLFQNSHLGVTDQKCCLFWPSNKAIAKSWC